MKELTQNQVKRSSRNRKADTYNVQCSINLLSRPDAAGTEAAAYS